MNATRCVGLLLLALLPWTPAQAQGGAWFPEPCADEGEALLSVGPQLVWVRSSLSDPGRDVTLRRAEDGALWASPDDLARWLGRETDAPGRASRNWRRLADVPELVTRFDACRQQLLVDLAPSARPVTVLSGERAWARTPERERGGYLNLDLSYLTSNPGDSGFGGLAVLGMFNRLGSGSTGWLDDGFGRSVRLDSAWFYDWPNTPARATFGDTVTRAAGWGVPVRYGGVQWGTDFALQPDRITFPLPGVEGVASVPSTLDVYVNGVRQQQNDVPSGPFVLTEVPVFTGAGELQVEVLDVLGRRQRIVQPFYVAPQLLKPGLDEYSVEAGWLRENYSIASSDYGEAFAALGWKHGVNDTFTWQQRAEATRDQFGAGTSLFWLWPRAGLWSTEMSLSQAADGRGGALFGAGFERSTPRYSIALRHREAAGAFVRLGEMSGDLKHSGLARVSVRAYRSGSFSALWLDEHRSNSGSLRLWGLSYTQGLGRLGYGMLGVTVPDAGDPQLVAGYAMTFGQRRALSLQGYGQDGFQTLQTQLQQGPPGPVGADYRVTVDSGDSDRRALAGRYASTRGDVSGEVSTFGDLETWRIGAATGIAYLDGGLFWSAPVADAFAVVDTDGVAGVRVYRDNLPVGRTRDDGKLLVTGLRPYQANDVRVDERDWPLERYPERTRTLVVPAAGAGVSARFPLAPAGVSMRLLREDGSPVPAGTELRVDGAVQALPVGHDGLAYVQVAGTGAVIEARWAEGACRTEIDTRAASAGSPLSTTCAAAMVAERP